MGINKNFIIPDAGLEVGTSANVTTTMGIGTSVVVGNSSVNTFANGTYISVGNSSVNAVLTQNSLTIGTFTTNASYMQLPGTIITYTANATTAVNIGANVNLSTTQVNVGNSTVNTVVTSTTVRTGNSSTYTNITSTAVTTNGTLSVTGATILANTLSVTGAANVLSTLAVSGVATFSNNVTISGNLTVTGTTTYVNTTTLNVADNIITLNADVAGAPSESAGVEVNRGTSSNVSLIWNEAVGRWQISSNTSTFGNVHSTLVDVVLGTDTSGNYVATISSGNGLAGSGTGEGSTPSLSVVGNNGIVSNSSGVWAKAANAVSVDASGINVVAGTELTSNSSGVHHNDIARSNTTTGNTSPNYGDTFTAVDSITTNARGHITAVNTKTVTMPSSNNTTYSTSTVANTVANKGIARLTDSSSANSDIFVIGQNEIVITSNSTAIYADHNTVSRTDTTTGNTSPNYGGTFTAVDSVTTNARGHVTAVNTKTVTMPASNNTTYDLATVANTAANEGKIDLTGSNSTTDTAKVIGLDEITISSNSTAVYVDHNDITRSDGTSTASPASGGTFTAVDSVTTNARGHVTAVNLKTVTLPVDPNTTYSTSTVANTTTNQGITRLTSSSNANTDTFVIGLDEITISSNSLGVYVDHNDIARSDTTTGNTSPNYGGTFTAVDSITTNARGHITDVNTKTVTMPSSNNTTYDLAAVANSAANEGRVRLTDSSNANDDVLIVGQDEITITSNSTAVYIDHNDITRSDGTSTASPASGGTFTAVDSVTTNARGHVTAINVKTVTLPVDPNTTYTSAAVANSAANEGRARLTSSGDANTDVLFVGRDELTVTSNSTAIYIDHNDIARTNNTSTASPASGGTFTAIDSITTNARGHLTAINTKTVTLPVDPNTTYTGANGVALSGTTFYAAVGATLVSNSTGIHLPAVATAGSSTGGISAITIDAQGRVTAVTGSAGYVTSSGVTTVTAGNGLTGGGSTSSVTVEAGAGNGISVSADAIYLASTTAGTGLTYTNGVLSVNLDNGSTSSAGKFYTGVTNPSGTTRLNYAGNLYVNNLYAITEVYAAASDDRLKTNVSVIESALDKIAQLNGFTFNWNTKAQELGSFDCGKPQVGVSAQQVRVVLPEAVGPAPFDIDDTGASKSGENYLTVQYEKLVPLLIEAVKELQAEVAELKKDR